MVHLVLSTINTSNTNNLIDDITSSFSTKKWWQHAALTTALVTKPSIDNGTHAGTTSSTNCFILDLMIV